jgi:PTH1 family peptidyl-tRNA hydrolase
LVVGLGNPGPRYVATRHNIGFRILECFGRQQGIALLADRFFGRYGSGRVGDLEVGLLAPQIFMNRSGQAVSAALRAFPELDPAADLLVLYDDLDLPLGRIRLRPAGGVGGHRGMADVADEIATREFPRLRFGIGRPPPGVDPVDYVLSSFHVEEEEHLLDRVATAGRAVEAVLLEGMTAAMDCFNREPPAEADPDPG